jgi:hypothetical protein
MAAMQQPKVSLGIILFGTRYLRESLPSLLAVDYPELEICLLDQEDGIWSAAEFIAKELPEVAADPRVQLLRGPNLWHSGGHNRLIQAAKGAYYIAASNDMLYAPDCAARLVAALELDQKAGSAAAKLYRWEIPPTSPWAKSAPFDKGGVPSEARSGELLDSAGIEITATGRFADRGQGQADSGQFDNSKAVWGASGALAAYRVAALREAALRAGQFFDPALHYKNDVELAARLRAKNWPCLFVPEAVVWHARGVSADSRSQSSAKIKADSLFGQLVLVRRHFGSLPLSVQLRHFVLLVWAALWPSYWSTLRKYRSR